MKMYFIYGNDNINDWKAYMLLKNYDIELKLMRETSSQFRTPRIYIEENGDEKKYIGLDDIKNFLEKLNTKEKYKMYKNKNNNTQRDADGTEFKSKPKSI